MKWNIIRFKNLSLKWKSFLIFMILVSIPSLVLGAIVLFQTDQMLRRQAVDSTVRVLDTLAQNVTYIMENVEDISSYMIYDNQFRKYLYGGKDQEEKEFSNLQDSIHAFSAFQIINKRYLDSIELQGLNGVLLTIGEPVTVDESKWVREAEEAQGGYVWSGAYPVRSTWTGEQKYVISLIRQIHDINDLNKTIGLVRIRLSESYFYSLISTKGFSPLTGSVSIVDSAGEILSHENKFYIGKTYPDSVLVNQMNEGKNLFSYSNKSGGYLVVARKIDHTNWYLVAKVDELEIIKNLDAIRTSIKGMTLFSITLGIMALIGFYWVIIRPIIELTRITIQVEQGDFEPKFKVKSNDEIGRLGLRFNKMLRTIQRLIETKYKLEIQHKESELKALQNQIDPHFLYNTLDTIHWTARLENAKDTSKLIVALSKLFRISLSNGKLWITLEQELEYVRNYLILQKQRVYFPLYYEIDREDHLANVLVPKKIIQPLVENCIIHGFKENRESGSIEIRCTSQDGSLFIDVMDDGEGFNPQQAHSVITGDSEHGFALRNIQERLTLLFGEICGLQFFGGEGNGAHVRITLPIIHNEEVMNYRMGKGCRE
ncbi:sensor histidine kinase [Paenibacillus alginolyticus]|uniref:cache domain-containing sensor histidine kinase n=1 Tax=Paenibacillus alginolyticus TaxID=59839 RepID=UPI00041802AA|nr:sensor histidine kinase [Paenibacillus alginolyticus]MCY9670510.1 sensor histidine kinase [Paenibacillus alginolyticus]